MGHWCRICGCNKPNEKFSGKGHRDHICKLCSKKPKDEIAHVEQTEEIFKYLSQSFISTKNINRLKSLAKSKNADISKHASVVLEVALVKPGKKRWLKYLARERRDLLLQLQETGLIYAHHH